MGAFANQQVILLPFPFSDLSASKLRPALMLANVGKGDWVLCQITSNPFADPLAVEIRDSDFATGFPDAESLCRPMLDLLNPQSAHADYFLKVFEELIKDKNYVQRLQRHYEMFRKPVKRWGNVLGRTKR
jgi:hypothetical protein